MLKTFSIAPVNIFTVKSLPECGRKPWLAMELSAGQGERTSSGPGGAHWWKSRAEIEKRRRGTIDRMVGRNIVVSIWCVSALELRIAIKNPKDFLPEMAAVRSSTERTSEKSRDFGMADFSQPLWLLGRDYLSSRGALPILYRSSVENSTHHYCFTPLENAAPMARPSALPRSSQKRTDKFLASSSPQVRVLVLITT